VAEKLVALVTGGSAGLGQDIARALKRDGYEVLVCARREDKLATMAAEGFATFKCDIGTAADVQALGKWVNEKFGRLDVLVNCAAISLPRIEFIDLKFDDATRLLHTNLVGTLSVTHTLLPLLVRQGGSIVNFSSTLAQRPRLGTSVYSASKGGIEAFTKALAVEVARNNVRVNCIAPALVRSEIYLAAGMSEADYAKLLETRAAEFPLRRVGEPEDVTEMVAYLVSPRATWMTGICIPIDGGGLLR
jgi:3-oxoacyl-[acyl-carrier protein] reductase